MILILLSCPLTVEAKDFIQSVDFKNKITQNPQLGKLYDKFNNKLQKSTSFGLHPYEIQH